MRVTVDIDDDVLAKAQEIATEEGWTLASAISELAHRGLTTARIGSAEGMPVIRVPARSQAITAEMVRHALDEY